MGKQIPKEHVAAVKAHWETVKGRPEAEREQAMEDEFAHVHSKYSKDEPPSSIQSRPNRWQQQIMRWEKPAGEAAAATKLSRQTWGTTNKQGDQSEAAKKQRLQLPSRATGGAPGVAVAGAAPADDAAKKDPAAKKPAKKSNSFFADLYK